MNKLIIAILGLAFVFIGITLFVELPPVANNIIYGFMGICSVFFLFIKRKELEITSMFDKKDKDSEKI